MNKWECQYPGCGLSVVGCGGAIGLRAIGWYFQRGPVVYCPWHRPDKVQGCHHDCELPECSMCAGMTEAQRWQEMMEQSASVEPLVNASAIRKLDAQPGDVFALELSEDYDLPTGEEVERIGEQIRSFLGDVKVMVLPPGTRLEKQPAPRHLGILRIGKDMLATMMGLPAGARIDAVSESLYFDSDEFALRIEHPALPEVQPGNSAPPIVAECTRGEFSTKIDWLRWMPGTEPEIRPDAKKLSALLREACQFISWRTADGLGLALRLRQAAAELEGQDAPSLKEANEQHAREATEGDSDVRMLAEAADKPHAVLWREFL